jgi:ParB-like chromosome segregation protein Spo0J
MKQSPTTIEQIKVDDLIPYATNSRTHSPEQVAQIAASMVEFGWTNPVLIDARGTIVAGHGRVMAARKIGMETVPCIRLGHLTPAQVRAYVIADNKLALNAGWDEAMLKAELDILKEGGFDLGLTGFSEEELESILSGENAEPALSDNYTHKVEAPIYTPKGTKPAASELLDPSRAENLIREIESAKLPKDVEQFLKMAASRHIVFNYEKIAEFYCHADKKTQELMEDSALVIIDFKKAMQRGYAQLSVEISDAIEDAENEEET